MRKGPCRRLTPTADDAAITDEEGGEAVALISDPHAQVVHHRNASGVNVNPQRSSLTRTSSKKNIKPKFNKCSTERCTCTTTSSTTMKSSFFRVLFPVSILMNFVVVGPLLLLSPKFSLMPDGIAVQVSHGSVEKLLDSDIGKGFVIQSLQHKVSQQAELNRYGKSCVYTANAWKCQDCGVVPVLDSNGTTSSTNARSDSGVCRPLKRVRKKCDKPMGRKPWDKPPRAYSSYDPTVVDEVEMRTLRELQMPTSIYLKQPLCSLSTAACFNLSKCDSNRLTIYTNLTNTSTTSSYLLNYAVNHSSSSSSSSIPLKRVNHPDQACLSITFPDTYMTPHDMYTADHWHPQGRNNLLWDMGNFQMSPWTGDNVFQQFHYEYAAVASQSLNGPVARTGYDLVLPLVRRWYRQIAPTDVEIHRPRRWLLTFRGDIQHKGIPYYNHRWLASEYWENTTDVLVDVQCRIKHQTYKDYDYPSAIYNQVMWNSTFGFCPGGAGVSSYRLGEYLSTGTIPVVVGDIIAPFAPELDWSGCWIVVSEARIVDLPRILRQMSQQQIRQRQSRCWQLQQMIWGEKHVSNKGWADDPGVTFTKGMEIWAVRVANAIEAQARIQQSLDPLSSSSQQ